MALKTLVFYHSFLVLDFLALLPLVIDVLPHLLSKVGFSIRPLCDVYRSSCVLNNALECPHVALIVKAVVRVPTLESLHVCAHIEFDCSSSSLDSLGL